MSEALLKRPQADQIAMSPYCAGENYALFCREEDAPFGKVNRWMLLALETGTAEPIRLKPSPCANETDFVTSGGQFFYYFERYPSYTLCRFDPATRETVTAAELTTRVHAFRADGDWLAYTLEPQPGDQTPETFELVNWKDQTRKTIQPAAGAAGYKATRWCFSDGKIYRVCRDDSWQDEKGNSLNHHIACYDLATETVMAVAALPERVEITGLIPAGDSLWFTGDATGEKNLYQYRAGMDKPQVMLQVKHDSYAQVTDMQLRPNGLFWLVKEMHSLLETSSTLWQYDFEREESILMIKLADFRALDIRFQVVDGWLYYADPLWKQPCCTPLDEPLTRETVNVPETGKQAAK